MFPERKIHSYCVGASKTGTTSIARVFSKLHSAHQPDSHHYAELYLALKNKVIEESDVVRYFVSRDNFFKYDMESTHLAYFSVDIFVSIFTEAKFILTVRDCYSWLNSMINQQLNAFLGGYWRLLRDLKLKIPTAIYAEQEKVLEKYGLYTLDQYLSYWSEHNKKMVTTIPKERLMIVKTDDVSKRLEEIADFVGIERSSLVNAKPGNVAQKDWRILDEIDRDFILEKIEFHCGEVISKYFNDLHV